MSFDIFYKEEVIQEDIPRLSAVWKIKIKDAVEKKLSTHPDIYGKPLRRSLSGYRKMRVGDYRVIFRIDQKTVLILMIKHRSSVYEHIEKRI